MIFQILCQWSHRPILMRLMGDLLGHPSSLSLVLLLKSNHRSPLYSCQSRSISPQNGWWWGVRTMNFHPNWSSKFSNKDPKESGKYEYFHKYYPKTVVKYWLPNINPLAGGIEVKIGGKKGGPYVPTLTKITKHFMINWFYCTTHKQTLPKYGGKTW